jgi:soluble cytochrome b562
VSDPEREDQPHMNRFKLSPFAVALAAALFVAFVSVPRAAIAQDKDDEKSTVKDLDTELAKQMETIDEAMKKLRRTLRKAESNKESFDWIEKMEKAAVKAKDMTPAMASKVPETERAKWVEAYKKDMETMIKTVGEMKAAVKDAKNDKAQELYKTLKTQEDKGHEKYTE